MTQLNSQTAYSPEILDSSLFSLPNSEFENDFALLIRKYDSLFSHLNQVSLLYFPASKKSFYRAGACSCGEIKNNSLADSSEGKTHLTKRVEYKGIFLGNVGLCCLENYENSSELFNQILHLALEELDKIKEENLLLAELGVSWECLQAVYDLNVDLSTSHNPSHVLQKITERATTGKDGQCAALWLENRGILEPVAAINTTNLAKKEKSEGALWQSFFHKTSFICNETAEAEFVAQVDLELKDAKRLAIVPVATRIGSYGTLAVWQKTEGSSFDSRLMQLLDTLALQAAMIVENERLHCESIKNERLQQEVEIGSNIQQTLLTCNPPCGFRGIEISALTIPSQKIDGDFYDFIEHGDECFDLIIGDVMGKGIPAALLGAATKNSFLRAVGQLKSNEHSHLPDSSKIVSWVNNNLTSKLMQFDSFVTLCYARFDLLKQRVSFVDCGHPKTLYYQAKTGKTYFLEGDNTPLGFSEREVFNENFVHFGKDDVFFFFSDGITETRNPEGEFFGDQRLSELVYRNRRLEPQQLISEILKELQSFCGGDNFNDDLTCLAVSIGEVMEDEKDKRLRMYLESDLQELAGVRSFIREAARILSPLPLTHEKIEQLVLAVNEAVTNIIKHAYKGKRGRHIEIRASATETGIITELHHWGEEFDPALIPPPAFDGSRESGFGLFIISDCVDSVTYSADRYSRNTISLFKKF